MKQLSPEEKARIIDNAHRSIMGGLANMDEFNEGLEQLEVQQSLIKTLHGKIPPADYDFYMEQIDDLKELYRFNLMVSLIHYDLKCIVKTGLAADGKPEVLYFAKQMQVIVRESFRTIFGFNEKSDYLKAIGPIIHKHYPERIGEYDSFVLKGESFGPLISDIKTPRDLTVHYDQDPVKVYVMLRDIDINAAFSIFNPYIKSLQELNGFILTIGKEQLHRIVAYTQSKTNLS